MSVPHHHGHPFEGLTALPQTQDFAVAAEHFKLLGDPTRLRLFWLLTHGEECVLNLSALLDMSSPALSHHLKLLRVAGLAVCRREGKEMYYTAAHTPQTRALHGIIEQMMHLTCPAEKEEEI